ncbi:hypothetical protein [Helicobacter cinaedi]|uniref:Uncharacterized protein n=1 Tax=Helicobacter cinaedi TaxID=213 RepID=A0A377JWJ5_9HELI|nr:hypothetical protein [Helicobacter cinaedi]STP13340.1 Uncharacterised protein [Helicobacter cinaedi]STP13374.1 Uncharacterised protein [Helicobacter cinaedi]STP13733.1 Uncharacterised protein [Helicobacter cinaedi]STP13742.1 Uncharacterised protein [Helicobacter cinaedi]
MIIKDRIKKWLGLEQISLDYKKSKIAYKQNLQTQRELLEKLVNFQSLMCREYLELKNRIEALEKELKDKE